MPDNRNNTDWKEHKNQNPQVQGRGAKEDAGTQNTPDDRLKDGTNDLQNGDQNEASQKSTEGDVDPKNT